MRKGLKKNAAAAYTMLKGGDKYQHHYQSSMSKKEKNNSKVETVRKNDLLQSNKEKTKQLSLHLGLVACGTDSHIWYKHDDDIFTAVSSKNKFVTEISYCLASFGSCSHRNTSLALHHLDLFNNILMASL